jgi:hypothetical protein
MKLFYIRSCVWLLVLSLMVPAGGFAQDTDPEPPVFRQEELDQMLAPVALYPDPLLVQVLMAATYPLEVVQAARWVNQNPDLKDDNLAAALEQKNWDPSVKSLVNFPTVLAMMNDNLEWTQNLGDAFLGQKDEVMATVQTLRAKAQAQGTLKTTPEQVVVVEEESIVIEPADPQIVYVPAYNPFMVYGPWWYPEYPPYYYHPHGYAVISSGFVTFSVGVALGAAWGYAWGHPNWHGRHVYVNPAQNISINRYYHNHARQNNMYMSGHGHSEWRHDPVHRKGVEYRAPGMRQQFGQGRTPGADTRKDFRGFDSGGQNQHRTPGAAPGFEQHRGAGFPGNYPPGAKTNDAVRHNPATAPQNRPTGAIESLNRGGSNMNQQRERGNVNRESMPAPQQKQPNPAFQGGGVFPNTGGNDMNQQREHGRGSHESVPAPQQKQPNPAFQGGKTVQSGGGSFPNTGGSGMNQQREQGRGNRESGVPAPQQKQPNPAFQGGGVFPNTGGSGRSAGTGGTNPGKHGGKPGAGSDETPSNFGGGMPGDRGQGGGRRQQ